jgi:hypothetical protein
MKRAEAMHIGKARLEEGRHLGKERRGEEGHTRKAKRSESIHVGKARRRLSWQCKAHARKGETMLLHKGRSCEVRHIGRLNRIKVLMQGKST